MGNEMGWHFNKEPRAKHCSGLSILVESCMGIRHLWKSPGSQRDSWE